jgi:hypothetical protein
MHCKRRIFALAAALAGLAALTGAQAQPASVGRTLQLGNSAFIAVDYDVPRYYGYHKHHHGDGLFELFKIPGAVIGGVAELLSGAPGDTYYGDDTYSADSDYPRPYYENPYYGGPSRGGYNGSYYNSLYRGSYYFGSNYRGRQYYGEYRNYDGRRQFSDRRYESGRGYEDDRYDYDRSYRRRHYSDAYRPYEYYDSPRYGSRASDDDDDD